MLETADLLTAYASGIREWVGASSVSLFVPAPPDSNAPPRLVRAGDPPVSEHATIDAAVAAHASALDSVTIADGIASVPGADPNTVLLPFYDRRQADASSPDRRRRSDGEATAGPGRPMGWLGIRWPRGEGTAVGERVVAAFSASGGRGSQRWLLDLGSQIVVGALHESLLLRDPMSGALGRVAFQEALDFALRRNQAASRPVSLLFVNPDDFAAVNQRLGREAGDAALRAVVDRVRGSLRGSDVVGHHGGAIYSVLLPDTDAVAAEKVAHKVALAVGEEPFHGGALRLRVSIGVAAAEAGEEAPDAMELARRADRALSSAKRQGGARIVVWGEAVENEERGHFDRLTGIFTGNMARDYRNMVLLWDAVNIMASIEDFATMGRLVAEKLFRAFRPQRVAFFENGDGGKGGLIVGLERSTETDEPWTALMWEGVSAERRRFVEDALKHNDTAGEWMTAAGASSRGFAHVVPLVARGQRLGGLFIELDEPPDTFDRLFLESLAEQLAVALDRGRLARNERLRSEEAERRLRAELSELKQALRRAELEHRSAQMDALLSVARRVAPTDATVLIIGESGTGKELLAHTVHELSLRSSKPWVVVDCGAIAQSLIDSELFGVEKGAFTGAQERRAGRLAEADGGTVLLDEIGELPLEVQSKLLRFVQEKQLMAVGGSRPRPVDARIIAATNRDLEKEVAAGRFRADLYHRLNVVTLRVPPLRERPDDILHLSAHFLATFAERYRKPVTGFSAEAQRRLLDYPWPGNVRELQNRIMQALILCEGTQIEADQLPIPTADSALRQPSASSRSEAPAAGDPSTRLRLELDRALPAFASEPLAPPIGKWLSADLACIADEASGGVSRRGASLLGVPETTFRRVLQKAKDELARGYGTRPAAWEPVRSALRDWVLSGTAGDHDALTAAEAVLLEAIRGNLPREEKRGAVLLGVTIPTYRRRLGETS